MIETYGVERFKKEIIRELGFKKNEEKFFTIYKDDNSDNGYIKEYRKDDEYEIIIAEYKIKDDFSISFETDEKLLRFGIVYSGTTNFEILDSQESSFKPSSFIVLEENIKGVQHWKKGQYFKGVEITVYQKFMDYIVNRIGNPDIEEKFEINHTYKHIPVELVSAINRVIQMDKDNTLNEYNLEAMILNFIGIIKEEGDRYIHKNDSEDKYGEIIVGNRRIKLDRDDYTTICRVKEFLRENFVHPPTIEAIGYKFFISVQKLVYGFKYYFNMTIGDFISLQRMNRAVWMLCNTSKSIDDISESVGYDHTSNFIRRFKKKYNLTPLKYRKREENKNITDMDNI